MTELEMILRLGIAALLGAAVGFERELRGQAAGFRTHILVSVGAALVVVTNIFMYYKFSPSAPMDPTRMAAQVVSGIGFLGAGTIMRFGANVRGLTTAASLWVAAAIGMAAGSGYWTAAVAGTVFVILGLTLLRFVDARFSYSQTERQYKGQRFRPRHHRQRDNRRFHAETPREDRPDNENR